jgi:hypothetical protein
VFAVWVPAKGGEFRLDFGIDGGDGGIERVDLTDMKAQQEAMLLSDAATQRLRKAQIARP